MELLSEHAYSQRLMSSSNTSHSHHANLCLTNFTLKIRVTSRSIRDFNDITRPIHLDMLRFTPTY